MLIPGAYAFSDLLSVLTLGLAANLLLGGPPLLYRRLGIAGPGLMLDRFLRRAEQRLNRARRGEKERRARGVLLLAFLALAAALLALAAHRLSLVLPYGSLLYVLLIALLIRPRSLLDEALGIAATPGIMGPEAACRAAIEYLAEGFAARVAAPALWLLLLGLPGLFVSRAVNALENAVGHRSPRFAAFGAAAARAGALLNAVPARAGGTLLALAAVFVPGCSPRSALRAMLRHAPGFASAAYGWPVSAMAGALGLALGGPRPVEEALVNDPWAGGGTARATAACLRRARALFAVAALLLITACAAALYLL